MSSGPDSRRADPDAGRQSRHAETNRFQYSSKQRVLLETIAPSPVFDKFCPKTVLVEPNGPPEQHIEILEWDVRGMGQMQIAKDF
jgi:hypothetical protein